MTPLLQKRSISLSGHATSLALEPEFWRVLAEMAGGRPLTGVVGSIDAGRGERPLASACRVAALNWARGARSSAPTDTGAAAPAERPQD